MNKMYMIYLLILVFILIIIKINLNTYKTRNIENFKNKEKLLHIKEPFQDIVSEEFEDKEPIYCGMVSANVSDYDEYLLNQTEPIFTLSKKNKGPKPNNFLYYHRQANIALEPFIKKKEYTNVPLRPGKCVPNNDRPLNQC